MAPPLIAPWVRSLSILSTVAPPINLTGDELDIAIQTDTPISEAESRFWSRVKPTVIVDTPFSDVPVILAPYGRATADEWKSAGWRWGLSVAGVAAVLFGAGYLVGRRARKAKA